MGSIDARHEPVDAGRDGVAATLLGKEKHRLVGKLRTAAALITGAAVRLSCRATGT